MPISSMKYAYIYLILKVVFGCEPVNILIDPQLSSFQNSYAVLSVSFSNEFQRIYVFLESNFDMSVSENFD